ncbi:DNA-binding protein [Rhizobium cremeum]|uniref:helix-turn-helix transcriptional regulator n=1 Tax=Rhizobium cremeum TaxID=2813827 RepID=UPI001FD0145A|nr:DNA-binding protein [Rhizobium cremeum]MCJ7993438.1 DNA-binding protein [Rhizobium cremeum]MCJ8003088.1 DNA-binding protein [Rhizobium cremeum]
MNTQPKAPIPLPVFKVAVSRTQAAALLDISTGTFDDWVRRGFMPQGVKIEFLRRWDVAEILGAWRALMENNRKPDDDDDENPFDDIVG